MKIEDIKTANKKLEKLIKIREKIFELKKNNEVGVINIRKKTSWIDSSYNVDLMEDQDLMKSIKALVIDKLERTEKQLIKEIDKI